MDSWEPKSGVSIEIHSLEKRKDLNGKTGRVLRRDDESHRFHVQVESSETIALKRANIRALPAGAPRPTVPSVAPPPPVTAPAPAMSSAPSATAAAARAASSSVAARVAPAASAAHAGTAIATASPPAGAGLILRMKRVAVGRLECGTVSVRFTPEAIEWLPVDGGWWVPSGREQTRPRLSVPTASLTALEIDPAAGSLCLWTSWTPPSACGVMADEYAASAAAKGSPESEASSILLEMHESQLGPGWHANIVRRVPPLAPPRATSAHHGSAAVSPIRETAFAIASPPVALTTAHTPCIPAPLHPISSSSSRSSALTDAPCPPRRTLSAAGRARAV